MAIPGLAVALCASGRGLAGAGLAVALLGLARRDSGVRGLDLLGECLDRPPEVVHAFEEQDQVVAADGLPRRGVGEVEGDPVVDVMFLGVALGALDRCEVDVEALDPDERIGLGQFDGGPTDATADASDRGGL
jgi:hypothetical protein